MTLITCPHIYAAIVLILGGTGKRPVPHGNCGKDNEVIALEQAAGDE
jgi:hypothetical protein